MQNNIRPGHKLYRFLVTTLCMCCLAKASMLAAEADPGSIDPGNWPQYHRTSNAWRYSPLDQINTDNVYRLRVAWIHQPGDITNGLQTTPVVVDGVVYYAGPFNMYSHWTQRPARHSGNIGRTSMMSPTKFCRRGSIAA